MPAARPKKYNYKSSSSSRKAPAKKAPKRKTPRRTGKFSKILIATLLFIVSATSLGGYLLFNKLNSQFVGAQSASSVETTYMTVIYGVINDKNSTTPLVASLQFMVYDFSNNKVLTYDISSDYVFNLAQRYGDVETQKLYALGQLDDDSTPEKAATFISDVLFSAFAFKADRYILVDEDDRSIYDHIFNSGASLPYFTELAKNMGKIGDGATTNLSLAEIYQTAKFVSGLPDERVIKNDIKNQSPTDIDDNLREITLDSTFAVDAKNIAILNASGKSGLAGFGSRVVKNLGGRVVSVDNADQNFGENFIVSSDPVGVSTTTLAKVFGITKVLTKEEAINYVNSSEIYRADVVVVLVE